jgi:hypothetical protein
MSPGVHETGLINFIPSTQIVNKIFVNNGKFSVLSGKEYFDTTTCTLKFSKPADRRGEREHHTYRTLFGYNFAHDGHILDNTPEVLSQALRRHMCLREADVVGYDAQLTASQQEWIHGNYGFIHESFNSLFGTSHWENDMRSSAYDLQFLPHSKRALRESAYHDIEIDGSYGRDAWLSSVVFKLKKDEIAKFNKYGRIIVDLKIPASLQGAQWANDMKHYMGDRDVVLKNCLYHFVTKPSPDRIKYVFETCLSSTYTMVMFVFSDDAIFAHKSLKGWKQYNLDFSSCDSSHTSCLFLSMFNVLNCPSDLRLAYIKQIMADVIVKNPYGGKEKIRFKPTSMYLQSGITITTLVNSYAWFLCFLKMTNETINCVDDVVTSCEGLGYIVTYEECNQPEDMTFLKSNPVLCLCCNEYQPLMNLGVIFRASGTCKGSLKGKGNINLRAIKFQSEVMNGLCCTIDNTILNRLNPRQSSHKYIDENSAMRNMLHTGVKHTYSNEALFKRYGLDSLELQILDADVEAVSHPGRICYSVSVAKILKKDYGLGVPLL